VSFYHCWDVEPTPKAAKTWSGEQVAVAINGVLSTLRDAGKFAEQVGSSYILGEGMDLDIVALIHRDVGISRAEELLSSADYGVSSDGSGAVEDDKFRCFRKGDVNVMLTADEDWFWNFVKSAEVCKALKLTEKWQRIAVHRVLMDDEDADLAVRTAQALHAA
jgi:hypothetical protein